VKILDFGLAKLTQLDGNQAQTDVPTRRVDTDPGVVMGTVGYMSPEQLKGRTVDQRTDIFAFGAILYEMLSGKRAFHGGSAAETMSAVLREDPAELSDSNENVSPALERLVNHCLEKDPEARFHSARDIAFALEALSGSGVAKTTTAPELIAGPSRRRNLLPWTVAAVSVSIAAIALLWPYVYGGRTGPPRAVLRYVISVPDKALLTGPPAISPDGRQLVYRLNTEDGKELLWLRALDSYDARPLTGTEAASQPFWSPDSRSVAFFASGKLKRIEISEGIPQTICDAPSNMSGTWSRNGVIIFSRGVSSGLYAVPAAGGTPTQLTTVDSSRNELEHTWPFFLPDGRRFLFLVRNTQPDDSAIHIGTLDSKESTRLLQAHSSVAYAPPGYVLFVRENTLMAQGFDASSLQLTGEAFPIAEQIVRNPIIGRAMFSVSENGVLVFRGGVLNTNQLVWVDRSGKQLDALPGPSGYIAPAISPNGKLIAVSRVDLQTGTAADIWLVDLERHTQIRLTTDPGSDSFPAWSPSGDRVIFLSARNGETGIYQKSLNAATVEEPVVSSAETKYNPSWSPDGQSIIYAQLSAKTNLDLYTLSLSGERRAQPFIQTPFIEGQARFSPNGKWVAYISNESGQFEVYVTSFPSADIKVPISIGGGSQPQWRADGRELYYYTPDRNLMAVGVNGDGSTFRAGVAKALFAIRVTGGGFDQTFPGNGYYTLSGDGERFLVPSVPEGPQRQQVSVVVNWMAELTN